MPTFHLTDEEAQQLMNRLINSDPLLMKIGGQIREQAPATPGDRIVAKRNADGKEARHE